MVSAANSAFLRQSSKAIKYRCLTHKIKYYVNFHYSDNAVPVLFSNSEIEEMSKYSHLFLWSTAITRYVYDHYSYKILTCYVTSSI